jgi:oxalate decarboxylase/phosphoglucose isomerase-like protein (cupin superfamily)
MDPRGRGVSVAMMATGRRSSASAEGRVGALWGDDVLIAQPGDLVFKPRNQWHTFWNAGDEPARILEIISPAASGGSSTSWSTSAA